MTGRGTCNGCGFLALDPAVNAYDVNRAVCCDPDKPALGARRVLAVSRVGWPLRIERPAWCRQKKSRRDDSTPTRKGTATIRTDPRVFILSPGEKKGKEIK